MPTRTLLDMTQDILRSMKLDDVNTLTDSSEALLVANTIKNTYYDLLSNRNIPEHFELDQLTALGDSSTPAIMQFPSDVERVEWIKYDKRQSVTDTQLRFEDVKYKDPTAFIRMVNGWDSTDTTNYGTQVDPKSGLTLIYRKLNNPEWWTTFDDDYVIFDGFDSGIDSSLQASKTQVYAKLDPTFTISDTFTPDLDANLFPLLFNVSKAAASIEVKKEQNPVAGQAARSQLIAGQSKRHKTSGLNSPTRPNFGRK